MKSIHGITAFLRTDFLEPLTVILALKCLTSGVNLYISKYSLLSPLSKFGIDTFLRLLKVEISPGAEGMLGNCENCQELSNRIECLEKCEKHRL